MMRLSPLNNLAVDRKIVTILSTANDLGAWLGLRSYLTSYAACAPQGSRLGLLSRRYPAALGTPFGKPSRPKVRQNRLDLYLQNKIMSSCLMSSKLQGIPCQGRGVMSQYHLLEA